MSYNKSKKRQNKRSQKRKTQKRNFFFKKLGGTIPKDVELLDKNNIYEIENNDKYIGEGYIDKNEKIIREGKGKIIYHEESKYIEYEGDWKNNKREGNGKMIFKNGNIYEGDWKNNKREGNGKMIFKNGNIYEGDWKNNVLDGKGKMIYHNHHILYAEYDGDWKNDKREGYGILKYINGNIYEGEWKNDFLNGKGKMIYNDKTTYNEYKEYEGDWKNNYMDGNGKMIYENGDIYEGEWKNNKKEGHGKMILKSEEIMEGNWINNRFINNEITFNGKKYNLNNLKNIDDSIFTHCTICLENISISDIYEGNTIGHEISENGVKKICHLVHKHCFDLWKTRNCENNLYLYCYCPYENKTNKHTFKIVSEINDFSLNKIRIKLHESCFTNINTYKEQMKKLLDIE